MSKVKNIVSNDLFFVCVCKIIFWEEKMYVQEQMGMSFSGRVRAGEVFWGVWVSLKHSC